MLSEKNNKLVISNYFKKVFSETSYHVWRSMAFKPNDQSYGHIHGIVCSNDLILCTWVHLGIAKMDQINFIKY